MLRTFSRPRISRKTFAGQTYYHRRGITSADALHVPGTITRSAVTEAGSTLGASAYNMAVAAYNRWGSSGPGTKPASLTPMASQAINLAFAQVSAADGYDIFLSTDANPLWVGRITEAQRAAGGYIISTVGTVTADGGASPAAAGSVNIGVVGTGVGCTAAPFSSNNAFTPNAVGLTPIDVGDYEYAEVYCRASVTDLRSAPTLGIAGFQQFSDSPNDWGMFWYQTVNLLTAIGQPLEQEFRVAVGGAAQVVFLFGPLTGQGTTGDLWVDLD